MKYPIAILFLLSVLLFQGIGLSAQNPEIRKVDQEKLKELKQDDDLIYSTAFEIQEDPLSRIWGWIVRQFLEFLNQATSDGPVRIIVLTIILLLFLFGILKLLGIDPSLKMLHRNQGIGGPGAMGGVVEDEIGQDFKSIIENAYQQNNYKEVVRNYYLFALDRMDAADIIKFRKGKTNYEYLDEVSDPDLRDRFSILNSYFVYAVYGEFDINLQLANEARSLFETINSSIK